MRYVNNYFLNVMYNTNFCSPFFLSSRYSPIFPYFNTITYNPNFWYSLCNIGFAPITDSNPMCPTLSTENNAILEGVPKPTICLWQSHGFAYCYWKDRDRYPFLYNAFHTVLCFGLPIYHMLHDTCHYYYTRLSRFPYCITRSLMYQN